MQTNRHNQLGHWLALGALTLLPLSACGDDSEELERGAATLEWRVGSGTCADAGTSTVEVRVVDEGNAPGTRVWTFDCDARTGDVTGLEPGTYAFDVHALDARRVATYRARTGAVPIRPGGVTQVPLVNLQTAPASWVVNWNFGGPLCGPAGVDQIRVLAYDSFDEVRGEALADCEVGTANLDLRPGAYRLVVQALSADQSLVFEATLDRTFTPADTLEDTVVLTEGPGAR